MKLFNTYHFLKYVLLKTSSVDGLSRSSKALSKDTLVRKNCHGECLVVCCPNWSTTAFWIPAKLLCLRSMLSKSMRYTEISRLAPGIGPQKGSKSSPWQCPTAHHTVNTSKVESFGLWRFASAAYPPDLLPTDYHFFKHLDDSWQGKHFHTQQDAKKAVQEFVISQSMDFFFFCYRNKQTYFSLAKMCWS